MAYDSLKNIIRQYIKTNGEQEITGQIMQNVLIEMVNNYPSTDGYIRATLSNLANGDILVYDSVGAWYNTPMSSFLAGYATQLWVNQQGYVTSSALAGYIHPTLTNLANGDILVYDSGVNWVNAPLDTTISGFGYVKSTGSVAYATSAGSANILGHTVYENPAHALANGDMLVYDSGTGWTNVETSSILSGYATQSWVTNQGYLTSSALNGYATQSWVTSQGYIQPTLTDLSNGDVLIYDSVGTWVNTNLNTTISGFGYITSSALSGYATESWVNQQGFLTSSALNGYIHPTLTNLANGDILVYDSVGAWYNTPLSSFFNGYATQSWVNTQLAGYLPLTGGTMSGDISFIQAFAAYDSDGIIWGNSAFIGSDTGNGIGLYADTLYLRPGSSKGNSSGLGLIISTSNLTYNGYTVYHSGNLSGIYLPLSGGTMAGDIVLPVGKYIYGVNEVSGALIYWDGTRTVLGSVGSSTSLPTHIRSTTGHATIGSSNTASYTILDTGNYSSILNGYIHPTITNLANGDVLIYDSVGAWVNTSLNTTIAGFGYITSAGSCAYANSAGSANILGHTVYENQAHALANGDMLVYDSGTGWTNVETSSILSGYATQSWVTNQGYLTSSALNGYATQSWVTSQGYIQPTLSNLSNGDILIYDSVGAWYNTPLSSFFNGYATESWVNQQGFLTSSALNGYIHPTLTNLANGDVLIYDSVGSWVNAPLDSTIAGFGYITSSALAGYLPLTGGTLTGSNTFLNFKSTTANCWIQFNSNNVIKAACGYYLGLGCITNEVANSARIGVYDDGTPQYWPNATDNFKYTLWHTGNLSNVSQLTNDAGYITASGSCAYATSAGSAKILGYSVTLNSAHSLSNGDILVYDTVGAWYNTSLSSFGFATQSWVNTQLAGYLPLTGGTLTGSSTFLILKSTTANCWIQFNSNNVIKAACGYYLGLGCITNEVANSARIGVYDDGTPQYWPNATGNFKYTLWHTGNLSNVSQLTNDAGYITASGSCAYATSAGSANILGHSVTENTAHSLSNGDTLVYDAGVAWVNVASGLSDIRQKSVISYEAEPMFEAVANAPAIRFTWKDATYSFRRGIHVGSIAQYWQTTIPEAVTMDNEGILSMQYDVIALLSTISVAKKVSEHERRIVILERENEELRKELAALKSA